jgi:hypothetical protein
MKKYR